MKNNRIRFCALLFMLQSSILVFAQLSVVSTGTGNTTGLIGTLQISNNTDEPQRFRLPEYFYIPSANGFQGYIVVNDALSDLIIRPGEVVHWPLDNGFCTNIHRPPVPEGQALPPFNSWITPDNAAPLPQPGEELSSGSGWVPVEDVKPGLQPTYPGWSLTIPGRIDPDEVPSGAAPVLFEALRQIRNTVDELYANGEVPPTPFAGRPNKEREALIQQTFWLFSSLLNPSDEDYTRNNFAAQTWRQFIEARGDTAHIAPEARSNVENGIQDFWNSFEAIGTKAKVLKEVSGQETTAEPAETCACDFCEVQQPMKIFDARTGELITENSIPTYIDRIRLEPPVVSSNCPESCSGTNYVSVNYEIRYRSGMTYQGHTSFPVEFGISGPGELHLVSRYRCRCDGQTCGEDELVRTIQLTESNNCCERIRNRSNGQLRFGFGNGTVAINRNQVTIHVPPAAPETFRLSFNLEAVFCNLKDDEVFGLLESLANQSVSEQGVEEAISVSDLTLGGPTNADDGRPSYSLNFSKMVNGREVMVSIILDAEACVFDIQVLYDGNIYEHAAPPVLTPAQLENLAQSMGTESGQKFLNKALGVLTQLFKVREYGRQYEYSRAMEAYLNFLHVGVNRLLRQTHDPAARAALNELLVLVVQARTGSGFSRLDELLDGFIGVVNRM